MPNILIDFFRRKILRDPQARWDYQYRKGKWTRLHTEAEAERLRLVANWLQERGAKTVLEIGCGEAIFIAQTRPTNYDFYLGTDVSTLAIEAAQTYANERIHFAVADMDTMLEIRKYDAIVFNEAIYYSRDVAALLQKMRTWLTENGCFVITIHAHERNAHVWQIIHQYLTVEKMQIIENKHATWQIELLKPNNGQKTF